MNIKKSALAFTFSCLACAACASANAVSLGKLTVLSSQGQPLRAEIELTSVAEDDGKLLAKLADPDAFRQAGMDFTSPLLALDFAVEQRDARYVVFIRSTQPIDASSLNLVLELDSDLGKSIQPYTLSLAPAEPVVSDTQTDEVTDQIGQIIDSLATPLAPYDASENSSVAEPNAEDSVDEAQEEQGSVYFQIKNGDTLKEIAGQFQYPGVSLEQMLVALQRRNSSAFVNGNMNAIRSGSILLIPDASEVKRIDSSIAKKVVLAQSADFNGYRSKLANQVALADAQPSTQQTNSGKIIANVRETPNSANQSADKLTLSNAQLKEPEISTRISASAENGIAQQQKLDAVNARVEELEQNIARLQAILDQTENSVELPVVAANLVNPETKFSASLPMYLSCAAAIFALFSALGFYLFKRKHKYSTKAIPEKLKLHHLSPATTPYAFDLSGIDFELPAVSKDVRSLRNNTSTQEVH